MNNWFTGGNVDQWRATHGGIADVEALAQRVADVIASFDPEIDVVAVQEGPSSAGEMQLFIDTKLNPATGTTWSQFQAIDGRSQKCYLLVRDDGEFTGATLAMDDATNSLADDWDADVDGDEVLEPYGFTRTPLAVDGEADGAPLRIVVMHTKSKFVSPDQQAMWNNEARRAEYITGALKNRRRISAEAMRVRRYLDALFDDDPDARVVVCGDLNDGPGTDFFERHYLTHGVADMISGSVYYPARNYDHCAIGVVDDGDAWTAEFDDFVDNIPGRRILLDHVMVSPGTTFENARVAHDEFMAGEDPTRPAGDRDRHVSDHRPVVVTITG